MKIGFFTDRYYPAIDGVAVSVEVFRRELEKLGHQVYIFCPAWSKKIQDEPNTIIRFKSFPSIWYEDYRDTIPWTPRNIKKIKDFNLDIIHVHTPAQIGLLGTRLAKVQDLPLVATYHTDIEQYAGVYKKIFAGFLAGSLVGPAIVKKHSLIKQTLSAMKPQRPLTYSHWNKKVIRKILAIYYNNCDLVIAPSKKMYELLKSYDIKTSILILPTGIDKSELNLKTKYNIRKNHNLKSSQPLLLFVGRLGKEKNIDLIIKAMPIVLKKFPGAKLVIVGGGPYKKDLKTLINKLKISGSVILTGMLDRAEIIQVFRESDIFVFPSLTDTQGLVINEACMTSKPVVFVDDMISELTINKFNGLKSSNNKEDLAKKIIYLFKNLDLAKKMGENGFKLVKRFTVEKQTKKLEKAYQKLINKYHEL
ncbi:MAG: glycosyltransferase [bacterium]|nr:glycosyltransferase [bacterium]